MSFFLLVAGGVLSAILLAYALLRTPPAVLAQRLRIAGGLALIAIGGGLLLVRQFALALPVGAAGFMMVRRHAATRTSGFGQKRSKVRSARLDMVLDHETGELDGEILIGRFTGRRLSELSMNELLGIADELRGDTDSLRLLEGYLDRAHPRWRENFQADKADGQGAASRPGGMDTQEAYEILGLEPHASNAEVREAHRRLMKQVHPDRGGTAALAARINEAKDRILRKHR